MDWGWARPRPRHLQVWTQFRGADRATAWIGAAGSGAFARSRRARVAAVLRLLLDVSVFRHARLHVPRRPTVGNQPNTVAPSHMSFPSPVPQPHAVADSHTEGVRSVRNELSASMSSLAYLGGKAATLSLGFLAWVVVARQFDRTVVGLAAGAVSIMMLCVQLSLLGLGAAVITWLPRHLHRPTQMLDTAFSIVLATAAAVSVCVIGASPFLLDRFGFLAHDPIAAAAFLTMTVLGAAGVLYDQISVTLRRGDQILVRSVVSGLVVLVMILLAHEALGATGVRPILLAWVAGVIVYAVLAAVALGRSLSYVTRVRIHRRDAAQLLGVGWANFALTIFERAPASILPVIATEFISPRANAVWYNAWMMAWALYVIPTTFGITMFADVARDVGART